MIGKEKYLSPVIKERVSLFLEGQILTGSVVNKDTSVQTKGQEVVQYDFSTSGFNSSWGE